jgi:hypothetical protein
LDTGLGCQALDSSMKQPIYGNTNAEEHSYPTNTSYLLLTVSKESRIIYSRFILVFKTVNLIVTRPTWAGFKAAEEGRANVIKFSI